LAATTQHIFENSLRTTEPRSRKCLGDPKTLKTWTEQRAADVFAYVDPGSVTNWNMSSGLPILPIGFRFSVHVVMTCLQLS